MYVIMGITSLHFISFLFVTITITIMVLITKSCSIINIIHDNNHSTTLWITQIPSKMFFYFFYRFVIMQSDWEMTIHEGENKNLSWISNRNRHPIKRCVCAGVMDLSCMSVQIEKVTSSLRPLWLQSSKQHPAKGNRLRIWTVCPFLSCFLSLAFWLSFFPSHSVSFFTTHMRSHT